MDTIRRRSDRLADFLQMFLRNHLFLHVQFERTRNCQNLHRNFAQATSCSMNLLNSKWKLTLNFCHITCYYENLIVSHFSFIFASIQPYLNTNTHPCNTLKFYGHNFNSAVAVNILKFWLPQLMLFNHSKPFSQSTGKLLLIKI